MKKRYIKYTEKELRDMLFSVDIESAVTRLINNGYQLVSVSYVGGCKASGQHVYHFIEEYE